MTRTPHRAARRNSIWRAILVATMGIGSAAHAAPEAQLRIERGPYYVGDPIELHLEVTGLVRSPEPTCEATAPPDTTMTLAAILPTVASSVRIVGGQVQRTENVTFTCQYVLVASRPGPIRLAPVRMTQGAVTVASPAHTLMVTEIPIDARLRIRLLPEATAMFVGQQVPVRIEWWLDESLDKTIRSYAIRSGLFDDPDTFRFLEDRVAMRGDQALQIHTAGGEIALGADVENRSEGGRRFIVVSAERRMVPLRAGQYDLASATISVDEVTSWQRDLFGSRRPAATRRLFQRDAPLSLTVRPTPAAGRPASFGGAIGRGFALEVSADRSVVQLGDPITLTLTVRGEGHLATVGLPPLERPEALPPDQFRLSGDELSGEIADGTKRFEVSVRVLDENVREIPAIEYAWFDPELGAYQTTQSRPIALSVRPAEVVTAEDVMVARPGGPVDGGGSPADRPEAQGDASAAAGAGERGSASLVGADLSIERRVEVLARRPGSGLPTRVALYSVGTALMVGAGIWRRRAQANPRVARLRTVHRAQRARIDAAADLPAREALGEVAAALRELTAADPALRSERADAFVRECDEVLYAPTPVADDDVRVRIGRARELADESLGRLV